ncbi:thiopeptide-type bacteriocin biosynthesis protein [Kutzneria kofuensis]|uniref:Thiopeptide-type bacteriocin biosynthesis protein n=1 Tax=Kutzneria kofuensis TaxID=103725 RepID=A0A7W9KDD8_9PSEU|nr:thiopeptide-type bacteriocin biosynthesis protein [Kutzneria kofuensis]MBB5890535.1 thiopeptide-type bacteriocin biosynthesis protein [Kutzneria kofuensis]
MLSQQERLTFIAGGLAALRDTTAPAWTQLGLARPKPGVYAELSAAVREMLAGDRITDFFFMHKPPGLRVRFAAGPGRESWVRAEANRLARRWHERGLIDGIVPGVYEPEAFLFGGPAAMPHVHRLFTADSVAWLDHHVRPVLPAWLVSMRLLRSVFGGLGLCCQAWPYVRDNCGRRVTVRDDAVAVACAELRGVWETTRAPVEPAARSWRVALERVGASAAEAAAYYVVFHWNRARMSSARQALITEALAGA